MEYFDKADLNSRADGLAACDIVNLGRLGAIQKRLPERPGGRVRTMYDLQYPAKTPVSSRKTLFCEYAGYKP